MRFGFILSLIFAAFVTIFALQNSSSVGVDFFFANFEMSQALVIFISAIAGALIVTLLGLVREIKLKLKVRQQTKQITDLTNENNQLNSTIQNFKKDINALNPIKTEETKVLDNTKMTHLDSKEQNNSKEP